MTQDRPSHGQTPAPPAGTGTDAALDTVRRFWACYQARRWAEAQTLLKPQACCRWWATGEHFEGAAAVVHVNAVYPEGWTLNLLELRALAASQVHSLVRVDHGDAQFYANSFFKLSDGRIESIDEYWSDVQAAPAWRLDGALPGWSTLARDQRRGLDLSLD